MEGFLKIDLFNGINEYLAEGLVDTKEATKAVNCDISSGSLKTIKIPQLRKTTSGAIHSLLAFYGDTFNMLHYGIGTQLINDYNQVVFDISGNKLDSLSFSYKGKNRLICTSREDTPFYLSEGDNRKLKNRRISYNDKGEIDGYIDANGVKHATENDVQTYAPKGDFVELHYDRLWIAGNKENPDRVYFSTASVNGADIEDFTVPIEEAEANQHGGFLDVRSYDGGKIIGLKVIFNAVVIFKNKSAYKIFGNSPDNYELVQMFSSNGAIADKSICVGNNGAFFLNTDGIYFYDGTNTNLISQKIQKTIKRINKDNAYKAVGIFHNNKYFLSVPVDNSTECNLLIEYDIDNKSFLTHELGTVTNFIEFNNELLFSDYDTVKSLSSGSGAMPMKWITPNYDYGKKNSRKNSNYIYFRGKGNGAVKFKVVTEKKEKEIDVVLDGTEKLYKKKLKNKGRLFRLEISNVNGSEIEIISPELLTEIDED